MDFRHIRSISSSVKKVQISDVVEDFYEILDLLDSTDLAAFFWYYRHFISLQEGLDSFLLGTVS